MRPFMTANPVIALDFDGTIKSGNEYWNMDTPPNEGAVYVIRRLYEMGCELVLWTSRCGAELDKAKQYLEKYGILDCFATFNEPSPGQSHFDQGRKIFANYYADDLNVGGFQGFYHLLETVTHDLEEFKNSSK